MYCKYTLRHYLNSLERYLELLDKTKGLSYYRYTIITNNIKRKITAIKDYLNIAYVCKRSSINEILRSAMRFKHEE